MTIDFKEMVINTRYGSPTMSVDTVLYSRAKQFLRLTKYVTFTPFHYIAKHYVMSIGSVWVRTWVIVWVVVWVRYGLRYWSRYGLWYGLWYGLGYGL